MSIESKTASFFRLVAIVASTGCNTLSNATFQLEAPSHTEHALPAQDTFPGVPVFPLFRGDFKTAFGRSEPKVIDASLFRQLEDERTYETSKLPRYLLANPYSGR